MLVTDIPKRLEYAVLQVYEKAVNIESPSNWMEMNEHILWCELVSCILGSKVSFEHAQAAMDHLNSTGFLNITDDTHIPEDMELNIAYTLSMPIFPPRTRSGKGRKYRYYRIRANHIKRTAELIYGHGNSIHQILVNSKDDKDARAALLTRAVGIGPKQASLFLRNIGYTEDLAILDAHVLRFMVMQDFISKVPKALSHLATYEHLEIILQRYARNTRVKLAYLDRAIWVVMRIFQTEFAK